MSGFHPMLGLTEREQRRKPNTREFRGDGSPYLLTPGLLALDAEGAVRVGSLELPATLTREEPLNTGLTLFQTITEPMVQLDQAPDGTRVLLRNLRSNDGLWQEGTPVYVSGEWETETSPAKTPRSETANNPRHRN